MSYQSGILDDVPAQARYLYFSLSNRADPTELLDVLPDLVDGRTVVLGIGKAFLDLIETSEQLITSAPVFESKGIAIPSIPYAFWFWLRGDDRGELVRTTLAIEQALGENVQLEDVVDAFKFDIGRDLSGYVDGTENPEGTAAIEAAIAQSGSAGNGSFVAVQKWLHDLEGFFQLDGEAQDDIIGRRLADNTEFDQAPESAHVKRAAQERFQPEAFMLRRSMPWADYSGQGLVFVAFGHSFAAFDTVMQHMLGIDDGVIDGIFQLSRPLGTSYFWCPPVFEGKVDLSTIGAVR